MNKIKLKSFDSFVNSNTNKSTETYTEHNIGLVKFRLQENSKR